MGGKIDLRADQANDVARAATAWVLDALLNERGLIGLGDLRLQPSFAIEGEDGGAMTASNGRVGVSLLPDGKTRMRRACFQRASVSASKVGGHLPARRIEWLYAEIDGIRAYVFDDGRPDDGHANVIVTRNAAPPEGGWSTEVLKGLYCHYRGNRVGIRMSEGELNV